MIATRSALSLRSQILCVVQDAARRTCQTAGSARNAARVWPWSVRHADSRNQPSAKFCGGCAARLGTAVPPPSVPASPESYTPKPLAERILRSRGALEGERKQVTVLFSDIKGSMELIQGSDPEEARRILDPTIAAMMSAVHRYEGTVNKVLGDGIMALFGAPIAHEDHAVRACYAALAMQKALRELSERTRHDFGVEVQVAHRHPLRRGGGAHHRQRPHHGLRRDRADHASCFAHGAARPA